jgi:hypothetical protein
MSLRHAEIDITGAIAQAQETASTLCLHYAMLHGMHLCMRLRQGMEAQNWLDVCPSQLYISISMN